MQKQENQVYLTCFGRVCCAMWNAGVYCIEVQNETCKTSGNLVQEGCNYAPDPVENFLTCAGLPVEPVTGDVQVQELLGMIEATLDIYSFMRSSLSQSPALELWAGASAFDGDASVKVWVEVKLKPLLATVSRQFLTCLSGQNFTCDAYQTMVRELSVHFSGMDPVRQKWIYMFFMYPFLSDNRTAGCASDYDNSEDWLLKNFGSFSAMASMKDFRALNMFFSGFDVLHLLSPEQKAELLLHPELDGQLDEGGLGMVFSSLAQPMSLPHAGYTSNGSATGPPGTRAVPTSPDSYAQFPDGFMSALGPTGSFVLDFVSFTHQQNFTGMTSATLVQAMLNWTLAKLAAPYKQNGTVPEELTFDPLDINDWFQYVVSPVLRRFLPYDLPEIPQSLTAVFHKVFQIETGLQPDVNSTMDLCSVTIDNSSCALSNMVEDIARVMRCAAVSNLTLTEDVLMTLVLELSSNLNALADQLSLENFSSPDSPFYNIQSQLTSGHLTQENLQDVTYIKLWFEIKLKPLLPHLSPDYLSCLSAKDFSCEAYQALVKELSDYASYLTENGPESIFKDFIVPFLSKHYSSDPGCINSAADSADWLVKNMDSFSSLATLEEIYSLNGNFSALEALSVLSLKQIAELLVVPFAQLPAKSEVINTVFDFFLFSPVDSQFSVMLEYLVVFIDEGVDCDTLKLIVISLYKFLPAVPQDMEPLITGAIQQLTLTPPRDCTLPQDFKCPITQVNETTICQDVNSSELQVPTDAACGYNLTQYACSELTNLTAQSLVDLLNCQLSSNGTYTKPTWKLLLTKANGVLNKALITFSEMVANMSLDINSPSVSDVLDALREVRLDQLSDEKWRDLGFISMLFSRLKPFLPSVSGDLLLCTSSKNLSCEVYQYIVSQFSLQIAHMTPGEKEEVLLSFIQTYLYSNASGQGCQNSSEGSADWLLKNMGSFLFLSTLEVIYNLNENFSALEALPVLSPAQLAELLVVLLPNLSDKADVVNGVFTVVLVLQDKQLSEFLMHLVLLSHQRGVDCESYQLITSGLLKALSSVPRRVEPLIWATVRDFMQTPPMGCQLPEEPNCPTTFINESRICLGVNSTDLQIHTDVAYDLCSHSVTQYACSELNLTAEDLASLLECQLSSNVEYSKETWKLLLTEASAILDEALITLSNMLSNGSLTLSGPAVSDVLDVLREVRLDQLSNENWRDLSFITVLFSDNLRPFLSSVSSEFLLCTSSKNLSCETYQQILSDFGDEFGHGSDLQNEKIFSFFIQPYLNSTSSEQACFTNDSLSWLHNNFGPFSIFAGATYLFTVNNQFDPLVVLGILTPRQIAQMMLLPVPLEKQVFINKVFDYMLQSPEEGLLVEVLSEVILLSQTVKISCEPYLIIIPRLYNVSSSVDGYVAAVVSDATDSLLLSSPLDCPVPLPSTCPRTQVNVTSVCQGSSSGALQQDLADVAGPCSISLEDYACSQMVNFTAENITDILRCQLSTNATYTKQTWKLLLSNVSDVLEEALIMFSHLVPYMNLTVAGPSVTPALDALGEVELPKISDGQWANPDFVSTLFGVSLRPFLVAASPGLLHCVSLQNLSCATFQHVVSEMSAQFQNLAEPKQEEVIKFLIQAFLFRNSTGACLSADSVTWLLDNYGQFSVLVPLKSLFTLNPEFDPLAALEVLSPQQKAELVSQPLPYAIGVDVIINSVFDQLLKAPVEQRFSEFLTYLVQFSEENAVTCVTLQMLFEKLYEALSFVPYGMNEMIYAATANLKSGVTADCILPSPPLCPVTKINVTAICDGVSSDSLDSYLSAGQPTDIPCNVSLNQYACSALKGFTSEHLVWLLRCQLSSNTVYSKDIWKLLFFKVSAVLDEALIEFAQGVSVENATSATASEVLEVLGEVLLDRLSPDKWGDLRFVQALFNDSLRPFLPAASGALLFCISNHNLSCATFQYIVHEFSLQEPSMDEMERETVLNYFIVPFLRNSDGACSSNDSANWLSDNFGSFSVLVSLQDVLAVNSFFKPAEVLDQLAPEQLAEVLALPLPKAPDEDVINRVFDILVEAPVTKGLPEALQRLLLLAKQVVIKCDNYKVIFERLYQAVSILPHEMEPQVWEVLDNLMLNAPTVCLPDAGSCPLFAVNETQMCDGVDSSSLLSGSGTQSLCNSTLPQIACAELTGLTAGNLSSILNCQLSSSVTYARGTWKLLLTKASAVLDDALLLLSNMSVTFSGPTVSNVLDVISEMRVDFTPQELLDVEFISTWFGHLLRPFLPSMSGIFLKCLSAKSLSCDAYQLIVEQFSSYFVQMEEARRGLVVTDFMLPFLSNSSTCISSNSSQWLQDDFGSYSELVLISELISVNPQFRPLEVLGQLSAQQMAELVALPSSNSTVINGVFDYLVDSPLQRGLSEFLHSLVVLSRLNPLGCESLQTVFTRLNDFLMSSPGTLEPVIWASIYDLVDAAPHGCTLFPMTKECPSTPYNASSVCDGVNSTSLEQHLDTGIATDLCNFSIPEYACASLLNMTSNQLVTLLQCKLPTAQTYSKETWKLLLTDTSAILNNALQTLSNQSDNISGPSVSNILDVLMEIRLDQFRPDQLNDVDFVSKWFGGILRPFLSSASTDFLQCLSSKNLTCAAYLHVLQAFSQQFAFMDTSQHESVLYNFIFPFLNTANPKSCLSNDSATWLWNNFGEFSTLMSLSDLLAVNTNFKPLAALDVLSSMQIVDLMLLNLSLPINHNAIINQVFDFLAVSPLLPEVLQLLVITTQQEPISCSSLKVILNRLDTLIPVVSVAVETIITSTKLELLNGVQPGCTIYTGECNITPYNETEICPNVDSTTLQSYLSTNQGSVCDFSIVQYACAELSSLTAEDLATLFTCKLDSNESQSQQTWKLFMTKVSSILGPALDLFTSTSLTPSPSVTQVVNMISEVILDSFLTDQATDMAFVNLWFQTRLKPFLPFVTKQFLSCLATRNFSCQTYQAVVNALGQSSTAMDQSTKILVYTDFIKVFLSQKATSACTAGGQLTSDWLQLNFGPFSSFASVNDLESLNSGFSVTEVLSYVSVKQLAEVALTPGVLTSAADVVNLMQYVVDSQFAAFFDSLASASQPLPAEVRSALLQQVFQRANLSQPTVSDEEVLVWLDNRMTFLLPDLLPSNVDPYFNIFKNRKCSTCQNAVGLLSSTRSTLSSDTQKNIYNDILSLLQGPTPLRCYSGQSYYTFLQTFFLNFQFPSLTTFLALIPAGQFTETINSMTPADLGSFLRQPGAVDDQTKLCQIFNSYSQTLQFLQTESVPKSLQQPTLTCVWPQALNAQTQAEVDQWFDLGLTQYLGLLNKDLISPSIIINAQCLAFRKFVQVLGTRDLTNAGFTSQDVYSSIRNYLSTGTPPKCYSASDPQLSSMAWFVNNIGVFISFISLDDFNSFGGSLLQPFTVNLENIQLFNQSAGLIQESVVNFYTELLFQENPNFNPIYLPMTFRCLAPASAFAGLNMHDTSVLSTSLSQSCSSIDPDVSSALASNLQSISASSFSLLGNSSIGLSTGQLSSSTPTAIFSSLSALNTLVGWNLGQTMLLVQKLLASGKFTISVSSDLLSLGTLITGVPSATISDISSAEILKVSQSAAFVNNIISAPTVVQETFVNKIITVSTNVQSIIANVPDAMAGQVPRSFLQGFSQTSQEITRLNQKTWTYDQAILFFDVVANGISDASQISSQVMQGFSCTRVETFTGARVKSLIKGCRRKGSKKVSLVQTQLTCMYNFIKNDNDIITYSDYPPELLLYYDFSKVINCQSYFTELGAADFSVLSSAYASRIQDLISNARGCLNITGVNLSATSVGILGNLACVLDGSYIPNSDESILQNLKNCNGFTSKQIAAMETLLLSGTTRYGNPSTWNQNTLNNLSPLPLYLTNNFWKNIAMRERQAFLRTFIKMLKGLGMSRSRLYSMMAQARGPVRSRRDTSSLCTVGNITQVEVSDDAFPFSYDPSQFDACLSVPALKDNLAAISDKTNDPAYQQIIMQKLNQAYPAGISDDILMVLGPVSRAATTNDISNWNVTRIDTLSALMKSYDGSWTPDQVQAILSKYVNASGNALGSLELNAIGGPNLCALLTGTVQTITSGSILQAAALNVTTCALETKKILFNIAQPAFVAVKALTLSANQYQLMQPYLGGAPLDFVRTLATSNISMDINTFLGLDPTVIQALNVSTVKALLGNTNVNDLKAYNNNTIISDWISRQLQTDLDTLGLGLTGGRTASATASPSGTGNTTNSNISVTATTNQTTGNGGMSTRSTQSLHCLLLALALTALCLFH
ncbi:uncharacterized protein mslnb isoform X2 [Denticeps clupeoides]|uniref:uncharacterized protein mslnb isoform X2 n=1 Tax=Denticeps clupeoides TaxID=299321 RepID=UPI0010A3930D|nr:uncharacterized protein LOC114785585 isoform X2 [Denticeps clupeoides]